MPMNPITFTWSDIDVLQIHITHMYVSGMHMLGGVPINIFRGCRGSKNLTPILAKLFRADGRNCLGGRFRWPPAHARLPRGAPCAPFRRSSSFSRDPRMQPIDSRLFFTLQRLAGASLLVFANKQDIHGSMSEEEIGDVRPFLSWMRLIPNRYTLSGSRSNINQNASMENSSLQCHDGKKLDRRIGLGSLWYRGSSLLQHRWQFKLIYFIHIHIGSMTRPSLHCNEQGFTTCCIGLKLAKLGIISVNLADSPTCGFAFQPLCIHTCYNGKSSNA